MKREVRITLSPKELSELLVAEVAKKQKLADGYACACTMTSDGEMALCFSWPAEKP